MHPQIIIDKPADQEGDIERALMAEQVQHAASDLRETWHEVDDGFVVAREQDVAAIVDNCKAKQNEGFHGTKDMRLLAQVPHVVVEHYLNINGVSMREFIANPEHMKRILNSPEFSDLRVWPGKV